MSGGVDSSLTAALLQEAGHDVTGVTMHLWEGDGDRLTESQCCSVEMTLGARSVLLYPLYHPAAALYTPSMLKVLEDDFARIPALLEQAVEEAPASHELATAEVESDPESVQLGLF